MADSVWIEAMQEELYQFDTLQVWELVDKPFGKSVIRLKWLWENKKEDQTVIHNKARLVAKSTQVFSNLSDGHENGISKWSTKGGGLCCTTGLVFDPDHPEKVYQLRKALYRLNQAPRAWYDELFKFLTSKGFTKGFQIYQSPSGIFINQAKYTLEILHKHGMEKGQSIGTPMAMKPKLDADLNGNPVDQTNYHSKIGSLMYLTSRRPEIVQALFRADHAGCIDTRKSTSGGIQFLGDKLVSWMLKKQNCTTMSSAKAGYVVLSASFLRYDGDECDKGIMPTKIELTLEQSQQGAINDILFLGDKLVSWMSKKQDCTVMSLAKAGSYALSWKPCQGESLNLPDYRAMVLMVKRNRGEHLIRRFVGRGNEPDSRNPGFHEDHYDNLLLTKETESEPIIWDIGDEEEDYSLVNKYPSFQEEPIVLMEEESCLVCDIDNKEEESMPIYDTNIKDVIEKEEGFVRK
uniref:Reverse transcriptase Ty1/copia-type domain-containing protein n=1 Tax=Tanacetum cinerariifolium TaxID=118510 RepID=A0A6L2LB30_TANCI|nr:hypothetical protein [Tanacetum cinerariifolium]